MSQCVAAPLHRTAQVRRRHVSPARRFRSNASALMAQVPRRRLPMKLGLFGMPLHPPTRPLAESLEEDADKVIHADQLGFDEVWIGEHMSCTTEPISSPLMFLSSLIHRTKNVRFGTGV